MVSGFRRDAPTVAVVTVSCTASPTSSIKTVVRHHFPKSFLLSVIELRAVSGFLYVHLYLWVFISHLHTLFVVFLLVSVIL